MKTHVNVLKPLAALSLLSLLAAAPLQPAYGQQNSKPPKLSRSVGNGYMEVDEPADPIDIRTGEVNKDPDDLDGGALGDGEQQPAADASQAQDDASGDPAAEAPENAAEAEPVEVAEAEPEEVPEEAAEAEPEAEPEEAAEAEPEEASEDEEAADEDEDEEAADEDE